MRQLCWVGLTLAFLASSPAEAVDCPTGSLTATVTFVRDGDTIEVGGMPIRLNGLAAPESDEPGGDRATAAMNELVLDREVRCELNGEHTYDRCVGVCYLNDMDIAATMVRQGLARDCPGFSDGRYRAAEQKAADGGATIRASYSLPGYCREG